MPNRHCRPLAAATLLFAGGLLGQTNFTRTPLDGATPPGLNPAGSYALSGFDEANLFSGRLNFTLPLLTIGGRGEARYTMTLRVQRNWTVESHSTCVSNCTSADFIYQVAPVWWNDVDPGYGPGLMFARTGWDILPCTSSAKQDQVLTRYNFMRPDGGEISLMDKETSGRPLLNSANPNFCAGAGGPTLNRKREFVTMDGSAATFYLDNDFTEAVSAIPVTAPVSDPVAGAGRLQFRDGMVYRIGQGVNQGRVDWIRDRNGNRINIEYDAQLRVNRITDPLNRITTVSYSDSLDTISYNGFGALPRSITVERQLLSASLATGESATGTFDQLFPQTELNPNYPTTTNTSPFDPKVTSKVTLPDGRFYEFKYNRYGELKRVTLPTGGYFEYDYDPATGASASGIYQVAPSKAIIRVVTEKRTYLPGGQLESKITFARAVGAAGTETTVTHYSGPQFGNESLRTEKHYFYGTAESSTGTPGYTYAQWKTGLEFKTEVNGLRRTEHSWAQRTCSPWYPLGQTHNPCASSTYFDQEPAMDPRILSTRTTLLDAAPNLTSKEAYSYDQFNNKTEIVEYDFGESTALRKTAITYKTDADYVNASGDSTPASGVTLGAHLRSLVSQRLVCAGTGTCDGTTFASRTDYTYDGSTPTANAAVQWQAPVLGSGAAAKRGNVTTETRYINATSSVSSTVTYDTTGNVLTVTNPRGKVTTISYADNCSAGPGSTFAFATSVTNPAGQVTTGRYDCALGTPVKITGPNLDETQFDYTDALDRLKKVTRGAGSALSSVTQYAYAGNTVTINADRDADSDGILKTVVEFDGLAWIFAPSDQLTFRG